MPPSRHRIPPQTSRKARRAYSKANKHFEFTPTQARASERRIELDKRAKALRAKEQRKKDNKRKRQEKEAAEREAKRQRSESSKAPIESLWGGARASQRRLNAYFARAKTADKDEDCKSDSDDQARLAFDYDLGQGTTDNGVGPDLSGDSTGLEAFFSSPAFGNTRDTMQPLGSDAGDMLGQPAVGELVIDAQNNKHTAANQSEDAKQALADAQLALSQGISDFDIAEDDDAEWMPIETETFSQLNVLEVQSMQNRPLATPSKRKAEQAGFEFVSPAKSARSALSEMSPSKVNIRAQERPDILSVASSAAKLPTPSPAKQVSGQTPAEILALISTQDLEDDEFATDKENEDPWQAESRKRLQKDGSSQKENDTIEGDGKRGAANGCEAVTQTQAQRRPFDGAIFDDGDFADLTSDLDDGYDDYDNDLDDEALAALAAESPSAHKLALLSTKNTATTADESHNRVKNFVNTSSIPGHASGPHNMRLQEPRPATATEGNSFSFDGVQDDDLTAFADELDSSDLSAGPQVGTGTKLLRAIPWKIPHHSPPLRVRMSV